MHESDCAVSRDGGSISLTLQNKDGKQCEVVLTFDEASSLAMTLPRLLKMALRRRYSDRALATCTHCATTAWSAPPTCATCSSHWPPMADLTLSSQSASRLRLQLRVTWPSIGACLLRRSLVCRTEPAGCRGGAAIRGAPRPPWPKPRRDRCCPPYAAYLSECGSRRGAGSLGSSLDPCTGRLWTAKATASPCRSGTTSARLCMRGRCSVSTTRRQ